MGILKQGHGMSQEVMLKGMPGLDPSSTENNGPNLSTEPKRPSFYILTLYLWLRIPQPQVGPPTEAV